MRWLGLACLISACSSSPNLKFDKSFLFGSATAGFQVEMGCPTISPDECDDRNSDWYEWVTAPELVGDSTLHITGETPDHGPGFYELYAQDLDRAANELHHNGFRLSIEWSRVFPTATDGIDGTRRAQGGGVSESARVLSRALRGDEGARPHAARDHQPLHAVRRGSTTRSRATRISPPAPTAAGSTRSHRREIVEVRRLLAEEFGGEVDPLGHAQRAAHRGGAAGLPVPDGGAHQSAGRVLQGRRRRRR